MKTSVKQGGGDGVEAKVRWMDIPISQESLKMLKSKTGTSLENSLTRQNQFSHINKA